MKGVIEEQEVSLEALNADRLKERYGKHLYEVTVDGANEDGSDATFLFKQPSREVLKAATAKAQHDPLSASEVIIENCLVEGDKRLIEDTGVFMAIAEHTEAILGKKVSVLKKL